MAHITIHVTGGIASYKIISLARQLQRHGDQVRVAMTKAATNFITPTTFAALTKSSVLTDLWLPQQKASIPHVELADWTELAIVAPATADIIAKMANGIADDAVSATLLATSASKVVVPAMNSHMWDNAATQRNIAQLKKDGVTVMEPTNGMLAEGYAGKGRMPDVDSIFTEVLRQLTPTTKTLTGKRFLISAGGTREAIDPVRFIGNYSSGKMGIALAQAAADAGAAVTLIVGQTTVPLPNENKITIIKVQSTQELADQIAAEFTNNDVLIMAAAVADFQPLNRAPQKIKKTENNDELVLRLKKTPDILKMVAAHKQNQFVVGFAAETQQLIDNANKKLVSKNADLIVANNVATAGVGFGSDDNEVTIIEANQVPVKWAKMSKQQVAAQLIKLIATKI
ncbi:bifunctional phosphopantothenoylcysteine decarboxylase/phosphopantothenate--cysteine ligase CoaBC [Paucilactobacillus wasatchensis]|uniref:Coenzyme A biosynthesis bifunctional protein CoaBC n=1 Tax=Paucilactobacillus wasatchensis TaxID=1335616 RepID=A0A0D1A9L9_9LACO|nr:bifunctional phosphopantothenoylcysteine decarboxylase/phosphopantothenate--cysteine ligase CoaBC [Paucilactobacillus wasatchensis]KIS03446.1 Phosphopantothenoylcysteine decarboxylase / Phosphopantothenoylcysteine synthetase [Paucilactobacillus wasatchensis]